TMRIQRQRAAQGDGAAFIKEVCCLTEAAESQPLKPRDRIEGKAVVEAGNVHVVCGQVSPSPQVRRRSKRLRHVGEGPLVRGKALKDLAADRLYKDGRLRQVGSHINR